MIFSTYDKLPPNQFKKSVLKDYSLLFTKTLYMFAIVLSHIISSIDLEKKYRMDILKINKYLKEHKKDSEILENLIPEYITEQVRNGKRGVALDNDNEEVSIVFADICDFDELCERLYPKDFISMLDKLYNTFDQICLMHGVQKIGIFLIKN